MLVGYTYTSVHLYKYCICAHIVSAYNNLFQNLKLLKSCSCFVANFKQIRHWTFVNQAGDRQRLISTYVGGLAQICRYAYDASSVECKEAHFLTEGYKLDTNYQKLPVTIREKQILSVFLPSRRPILQGLTVCHIRLLNLIVMLTFL